MKKNARRAVFFDVIAKTSAAPAAPRLGVPRWWRRDPAPPPPPQLHTDQANGSIDAGAPIVWRSDGMLIISLGQIGRVVTGAGLCVVLLVAFGLGRKSVNGLPAAHRPTIAAVSNPGRPDAAKPGDTRRDPAGPRRSVPADDLDQLLAPPKAASVRTNPMVEKPIAVPARTEPSKPERLKYLRIESVMSKSPGDGERVEEDARSIQEFLKREGVPTTLKWVNNRANIIIYSAEGYSEGDATTADRNAFQKRIEEKGRLYFKTGGGYSFKGCQFVN